MTDRVSLRTPAQALSDIRAIDAEIKKHRHDISKLLDARRYAEQSFFQAAEYSESAHLIFEQDGRHLLVTVAPKSGADNAAEWVSRSTDLPLVTLTSVPIVKAGPSPAP